MHEYLNTDLELRSAEDLSPLAQWFEHRTFVLHNGWLDGEYLLALEANCQTCSDASCPVNTPESTLTQLLDVIADLPPEQRELWHRCRSRTFDIGIAAGSDATNFSWHISPATLHRIAAAGAGVAITVYPPQPGDDDIEPNAQ